MSLVDSWGLQSTVFLALFSFLLWFSILGYIADYVVRKNRFFLFALHPDVPTTAILFLLETLLKLLVIINIFETVLCILGWP